MGVKFGKAEVVVGSFANGGGGGCTESLARVASSTALEALDIGGEDGRGLLDSKLTARRVLGFAFEIASWCEAVRL